MQTKGLGGAGVALFLLVLLGCSVNVATREIVRSSPVPRAKKTLPPTPTPSPSFGSGAGGAVIATPTPSATASQPLPSPVATSTAVASATIEGPAASEDEVASATAFPFTQAGQRWTYAVKINATLITPDGTMVLSCQDVTATDAGIRTQFEINVKGLGALGGGSSPAPVKTDRVQRLPRNGGNPYANLMALLFDPTGKAEVTITDVKNVKQSVAVNGRTYPDAVRQTFKSRVVSNEASSTIDTTLDFDMYLVAGEGMVKEVMKGTKVPPSLLPANLANLGDIPFTMTLDFQKRDTFTPEADPVASGDRDASGTEDASGSITS